MKEGAGVYSFNWVFHKIKVNEIESHTKKISSHYSFFPISYLPYKKAILDAHIWKGYDGSFQQGLTYNFWRVDLYSIKQFYWSEISCDVNCQEKITDLK